MKYGFSFQGSKSKIANDIVEKLPNAKNFYDLFAGGCAVTHAALLSKKWENIIANDIKDTCSLFLRAIKEEFKNEKRWISREDFFKLKDSDPYIRWIWSFGNNGSDYLFGKGIEQIKKEAHEFLFENGYNYTTKTRIELTKSFKEKAKLEGRFELEQLERLEQLQQLLQLEQLLRLERLQQLLQLERLEVFNKDYQDIEIKSDSVVYCDIPYCQKRGSKEKYYGLNFDTIEFYEWAKTRNFPVFFSSCFCDDTDFKCIWEKEKQCLMNNKNSHGKKVVIEKLFYNGK